MFIHVEIQQHFPKRPEVWPVLAGTPPPRVQSVEHPLGDAVGMIRLDLLSGR